MGYSATVYCRDAGITSTTIYNYMTSTSTTRQYNSSDTTIYDLVSSTIFSATVSSNKNFFRWVYREGSTSGTVQYSYDNPFIYSSGNNIFIRAESVDGDDKWGLCLYSIGTISNNAQRYVDISARNTYCFAMEFDHSGTATFYSSGADDVQAWLSSSVSFNTEYGRPIYYHQYNDDGAGNGQFQISFDVNPSTVYYLWISMYSSVLPGKTTLYVNISGEGEDIPTYTMLSVRNAQSQELLFGAGDAYRISVSFALSGVASFYTEGDSDTYGYLSTSATWDPSARAPTPESSTIEKNDDGGDGLNFKIERNVTAGATYYVYVRLLYPQYTGRATFWVIPPSATPYITKWSWQTTNGTASIAETQTAYTSLRPGGTVSAFSHKVWNDMCDKVNEILTLTGRVWNAQYAPFNATKMTESDRTLTAARFNSLRFNIGRWYATGIDQVSSGDIVRADYFLTLAAKINEWIDVAVQNL